MALKKNIALNVLVAAVVATPLVWPGISTVIGTGGWYTAGVEWLAFFALLFGIWVVRATMGYFRFRGSQKFREPISSASSITLGIIAGAILGIWLGTQLRMHGFELAAERAKPLVVAVEEYVAVRGVPPEELDDLVPDYLSHIPQKLPPIEIVTDERALAEYGENTWALSALVSRAMMNWDRFIYFPDRNYPESGFGGTLERVGDWAYVHE